jgi:hypothetical protein
MRGTRVKALRREFIAKFGRGPRGAVHARGGKKKVKGLDRFRRWVTVCGNEFRPIKKRYLREAR